MVLLGDSHLTDKQEKIDTWATAIEQGKRCIAINEEFAQRVKNEKEKDAVSSLKKEDAPCLYWLASSLGKWGKIQGIAKVLGQLPTVKAYITKVQELDPEYFHYGPARYWGAYYSASSFTADDEKSAENFAASIDGAPYYLPTRGLRAGQLAVRTKDFEMFAEDIKFILAFDPTSNAELVPENTLEQSAPRISGTAAGNCSSDDVIDAYEQANPE